jgi:hypothetical protein
MLSYPSKYLQKEHSNRISIDEVFINLEARFMPRGWDVPGTRYLAPEGRKRLVGPLFWNNKPVHAYS